MDIKRKGTKDLAILLAWPQTWCKQPGSWYDNLMAYFGVNKNHYYAVGHAAVVLVEGKTGRCYYFDFGRYHAPYQFGRARGALTDPELEIRQTAKFDQNGEIVNLDYILEELSKKEACHGQGKLFASVCQIIFNKAYQKALEMQELSPLPYGPFTINGSNCSRFVNEVVKAGQPKISIYLKLNFPKSITPTPLGNVKSAGKVIIDGKDDFYLPPKCNLLHQVLEAPQRYAAIPISAIWLAGEGAGSWYDIKPIGSFFHCRRFDEKGRIEFSSVFEMEGSGFIDFQHEFEFGYPSHFQKITIIQKNRIFSLKNIGLYESGSFQNVQRKACPKIDFDFMEKMTLPSN
jgi:hypothetical protein